MREQSLQAATPLEAMLPYQEMLEKALEFGHNTHSFRDIVRGVASQDMQFWPMERSCLVTEICEYPNMRALHIFLAAGDLSEIKSIDETLGEWAKQLDAQFISLSGRKGWVKALADLDYKVAHVTMYKEVK